MADILRLARIQIFVIVLFIIGKSIRSSVLNTDGYEWLKGFLLSFPNLCEGILGVLLLTGIGLYINKKGIINNSLVYLIAVLLATIYVLTQEFKIHNIGGNNVFDKNDVLFSIIGLILGGLIVRSLKPKFIMPNEN